MDLKALLVKHEGKKNKIYYDTKGIATIGVGRNLEAVGLSDDEVMYLLANDIKRIVNDCVHEFPWFSELSEVRQYVVIDMVFNCGMAGFKGFKRFIAAVLQEEWARAAAEIIDSDIAPLRAGELATLFREG